MKKLFLVRTVNTALLACILAFGLTPALADVFYFNLILNPGAEAGPGSPTGSEVVAAPNWTSVSNFTVIVSSAAPAFGKNAFIGGPDTPLSSARQTIDVSSGAG